MGDWNTEKLVQDEIGRRNKIYAKDGTDRMTKE